MFKQVLKIFRELAHGLLAEKAVQCVSIPSAADWLNGGPVHGWDSVRFTEQRVTTANQQHGAVWLSSPIHSTV